MLAAGELRLLSVRWLLASRDSLLANVPIARQQDLPEEAFVSNDEAVRLHERGLIFVLSYRWLTAAHPDPHGDTLRTVLDALGSHPANEARALFWDFCSLPQKGGTAFSRTGEEDTTFRRVLKKMGNLYFSRACTIVLSLPTIPPRPAQYDGVLQLFNVTEGTTPEAIIAAFQRLDPNLDVVDAECPLRVHSRAHGEAMVAQVGI